MTSDTPGETPRILGPADGEILGPQDGTRDRFLVSAAESGGGFALVEHIIAPRELAAPLHLHTREDEYSYVLAGRVGALLGDHEVFAGPGNSSSSRAGSGTRSGTPGTPPCASSRSSPPQVWKSCSARSATPHSPSPTRWPRWRRATAPSWTSRPRWRSSSVTACGSKRRRARARKEHAMYTVHIDHHVADFAAWKAAFDSDL